MVTLLIIKYVLIEHRLDKLLVYYIIFLLNLSDIHPFDVEF